MADNSKKISIRLSLEDAEKVKAQLAALGDQGQKALRQIEAAAKQPTPALKALNEVTGEAKNKLGELKESAGVTGRALSQFGTAGTAAAVAVGLLVAGIRESTKAAAEAETIHMRLDAVLKATGNTTGLAKHQFDEIAESMSKAFAIDDDKIKQAATTLASFSSISGEAFKGTLEQAAHLSAVFGGDLNENVEKIAVTMERLAGGSVDGLNKAFKFLSEAEKEQLKQMAENGRGFEAQIQLVDDLKKHLGAAGTEDSLNKSTERLSIAWDDLLKSIGNTRPWIDLMNVLANAVQAMNDLIGKTDKLNSIAAIDGKLSDLSNQKTKLLSDKQYFGAMNDNPDTGTGLTSLKVGLINRDIEANNKLTESLQKQRAEMQANEEVAKNHAEQVKRDITLHEDIAAQDKDDEETKGKLLEQGKQIDEQRKRAIDTINKQLEALRNEGSVLGLNDRERKVHLELLKAEQTAQEAGLKLSDQTRRDIISAANSAYDSEEMRKLSEKQAKQISENIKHATDEIVNYGQSAFESILEGGDNTFKSLSENLVKFMRKAFAQIAAEAVIRPLIQPVVSDFLGGGGTSGSVAGASSGASTAGLSDVFGFGKSAFNAFGGTSYFSGGPIGGSFSGAIDSFGTSLGFAPAAPSASFVGPMPAGSAFGGTTFGGFLGGAGLGFGAGTLLNGLVGGNSTGGTIGSAGGALAGAAIGSIVPGIGTVLGGLLGGAGGGLLGGLFGGDDAKYKEAVHQRELTQQSDALSKQISQLIASTAETSQFAQALDQVSAKFADAKAQAQQYGLSIEAINRVEQQQIEKLKQSFRDNIESQIASLENNPSASFDALKKAQDARYHDALLAEADMARVRHLSELETQNFYKNLTADQLDAMGELASAADKISISLQKISNQLSTSLQDQLSLVQSGINEAKQQADAYRSLATTLRDEIFGLKTGNLTTLSQSDALAELRDRFSSLSTDAKNGNQSALRALPQVANSLLEASSRFYGSTEAYAKDFTAVNDALQMASGNSDNYAGATDYKSQMLSSQMGLLKSIQTNLAKPNPDGPLLKQQLSALGTLGDLLNQTNDLSADQAALLTKSNAVQDILSALASKNIQTSQDVIEAITGSSDTQTSIGMAIVSGTYAIRDLLNQYLDMEQKKQADDAANAARQALIDAHLAQAVKDGKAIQTAINTVPIGGASENQHSWGVVFDALNKSIISSNSLDRGSAEYDAPRAEAASKTIMEALNVVLKTVGITGDPLVSTEIATKYGSSIQVGDARFKTGINDYQGLTSFAIMQGLLQGTGGNKQLVDFANGLNWYDYAGSLYELEKKAVDLGLRGFASGTDSAPPGLAWVGEEGPEIIRFRGGEQVIPARTSSSMHQADVVAALQAQTMLLSKKLDEVTQQNAQVARQFNLMRIENRVA